MWCSQNAEMSLGISPDASVIAAASKLLLDAAVWRRQAVRLSWPYGGHSMEVAGDVLGGWHVRAPLSRQASSRGCSTEIQVRARCWYRPASEHPVRSGTSSVAKSDTLVSHD